jgi:hypothetical protein
LCAVAIQAVEVDRAGRGESATQVGMVQEDRFLHERDDVSLVGNLDVLLLRPQTQLVLQLAPETLRFAPGQLERRILVAPAVAGPPLVIAAEGAGVVLEFDEMELPAAEQQQVDLVPSASQVGELEVRPGPIRRLVWHDRADQCQPFGFARKLRERDLDPPVLPRASATVHPPPPRPVRP